MRPAFRSALRLLAASALTILVAAAVAAQEGAAPDRISAAFGRPRYMIYLFEAEAETLTEEQSFILYNSILSAAAEANPDVVILESPDPGVPRTKEAREELARRINADCWLTVTVSGGYPNITIEAQTFDILRQEGTGDDLIRPGFVVDSRVIARGFWGNIVGFIRDGYKRIVDVSPLVVRGRPGTELSGVPGGPYRIDETGVFSQDIPYPSVFTLRARSQGAYDVVRHLTVGIEPVELDLDQVSLPWFGAELSLSSLQFPGARFWASIRPARLFVRLGLSTQLVGLYLLDNSESLLKTGSPLSLLSLDAGAYILPPEQLFRLFVAAGGYLRIAHPEGHIGVDRDAAPGALTLSLGGEYSPSRRFRFVFAYEPAYILASDPARFISLSFAANSYPSGEVPGYVVLPGGLLDLRNFFLGVRMDF